MKNPRSTFIAALAALAVAGAASGQSAGKPPEQLGKVSFANSCAPAAQASFERGVALLHSFWFREGERTFASALKAAAILEDQFKKHPDHPGVAHYLIHSYDYPPIAGKGLTAAKRYSEIAPSAPHALHMPSHIFTRVGAWRDSAATNLRSASVARAEKGFGQQLHAMEYQVFAHLQLARATAAYTPVVDARRVGL